jgi:hypothetical protein
MAERWTLIFYRAPAQPSSARVTAWRRLNRLGAVYLGPSSCLLPARLEVNDDLQEIAANLTGAGGSLQSLTVAEFSDESERRLEALYNAARDAEYEEVIERAEALIGELEREGARDKFTFAEVEENDADLAKLQRWARRVRWRDVYGAPRRQPAEDAVRRAQARLDEFVRIAASREHEPSEAGVRPEGEGGIEDLGDARIEGPSPGD